jgi:hypothetical protein
LRAEIKTQLEDYVKLCKDDDESFVNIRLDQLLDLKDSFVYLMAREKEWSAVDLACKYKRCYKWTVCAHNTLIGLIVKPDLIIPEKAEQAEPRLRKARGRRSIRLGRGIADVKR